jgi:hypothetical protein
MSIGEKRVRVTFNPSAMGAVDQIKQQSAALIDLTLKTADGKPNTEALDGARRCAAIAADKYEEACMWGR